MKIIRNSSIKEKIRTAPRILVFLFSPAVMYLVFEWLTGNLWEIRGLYLLWNLLFFYAVYAAAFCILNSMKLSFLPLNVIFTIWALAEHYVTEFRGRPIMLWDLMAFQTAATVAGNYEYEITPRLVAGVLVILVWSILIWKCSFRIRSKKKWGAAAVSGTACLLLYLFTFFHTGMYALGIEINMWEPAWSYAKYGYMVSTLRVMGYLSVDPPDGYSVDAVNELWGEIRKNREEAETDVFPWKSESDVVPENIICIMNESYSDLRVINPFRTDVPFMNYYDSLDENCMKGSVYVDIFGSMTSNSEYEFLTGNSMAFAPSGSVPYQIYMRNPTYSLPLVLKDQGYRTVAIHPNEKVNWNRDEAYREMGFDEFYGIESFEGAPLVRSFVADIGDYQKIIRMTTEKEAGQKLFIFDVTMQNHGGYEEDFESTVHLMDYDGMTMTEQYLSLIRESDQALEYLLEYYSQVEEPTMIVMFGDHQPSIEPEFYEALYGCALSELSPVDYVRRYRTPFLIWTNYETDSRDGEQLSLQYLSSIILQRANLGMTDYQYFLNEMYKTAPVVHLLGYYTSDWQWESWTNWKEKKEYSVFRQFDILQYHSMFEKKRVDGLFRTVFDTGTGGSG